MNGELEITGGCGVMEREKRGRRRRAGFAGFLLLLLWLREIAGKKKGVLVPEGSLNYCIFGVQRKYSGATLSLYVVCCVRSYV